MQRYEVFLVRALCFLVSIVVVFTSDALESAYGDEWLYFLDDNGTELLMNFSSVPNDTRNMIFGDAYFYLYTRHNEDEAEKLSIPDFEEPFQSEYFNKSNDITVVTHGWRSAESADWLQNIKKSLLKMYDLNVITVDWNELSKNVVYPFPAFSTRYVGKRLAKLLDLLVEKYELTAKAIHLIGHSLGSHVMGYAGMFSENKIFRITGLDPARPLFEIPVMPLDFRLDRSDAEFVDIIHTCAGIYGYKESYGHADFYPNNGQPIQPGCSGGRLVIDGCSHKRSYLFFDESVEYKSDEGFVAYLCESWEKFENGECEGNSNTMGYSARAGCSGNYYLRTRNESKYANNNHNFKKKSLRKWLSGALWS